MKQSIMFIRHLFLPLVCVVGLCLVSCERLGPVEDTTGMGVSEDRWPVSISIGGACGVGTKATGISYATDEATVVRWACMIYRDDEVSPVYRLYSSDGSVSVKRNMATGHYTAVVVANYPESGETTIRQDRMYTMQELLSRVTPITDNRRGSFLMFGVQGFNVAADVENDVTVNLKRLVSKVSVGSISVDFEKAALQTKSAVLKSIFLTNTYRSSRYGSDLLSSELSASVSNWYNAMGPYTGGAAVADIDALVCDTGINHVLQTAGGTSRQAMNTQHVFYTYPNPRLKADDTRSADWCPRSTRLVMEVEIDGRLYYYNVTMPNMARNIHYNVASVVIKDLGSIDPEQDIPGSTEVTFGVQLQDSWDYTYNVNEES